MYSEHGLFIDGAWHDARDRGGEIVSGGARPAERNAGFFQPTVITGVRDDAKSLAEENFGPIAVISPVASDEEAYRRANDSPCGLSAYAFTRSAARAWEAIARLRSGMVGINYSGTGRKGGTEGIADYCNLKPGQVTLP